ncbi:MAG: phosphoglycerate mutase family protein [Candidatus Margulisbacteria bacterium]|nr:phosphoglycerate mutase family protein [Candidatus Margulisiibacteriota bacterium]
MLKKIIAEKQIFIFRHGHSKANTSRFRRILFPGFFKILREYFGFQVALKGVQLVDRFRNKHTPFRQPDYKIPLEPIGKIQAELTGRELATLGIIPDLIVSSDYLRTRQTTAGIIKGFKAVSGVDLTSRILYSELIVERRSGKTSGYPQEYYPILFPEVQQKFETESRLTFRPPDGESILDVRNNRIPDLAHIINLLNFKTLFIVGHGLTNSTIRSLLTQEDMAEVRIGSPNLGVYKFVLDTAKNIWVLDQNLDGSTPISEKITITN